MSQLRSVARIALIAAAFLIAPRPAAAGRLQDCCSKKNTFCIIPYAPGAAACNAAGGMFFAADACTNLTQECGVVHQRTATGTISLQTQPSGQTETMSRGTSTSSRPGRPLAGYRERLLDVRPHHLDEQSTRPYVRAATEKCRAGVGARWSVARPFTA